MSEYTDKQLLEWAAKAAGYQVEWVRNSGCFYRCEEWVGREQWSPLEDDGDALRLAISLKITIGVSDIAAYADRDDAMGIFIRQALKRLGLPDLSIGEAVRRAIVRAAAEIGRAMP